MKEAVKAFPVSAMFSQFKRIDEMDEMDKAALLPKKKADGLFKKAVSLLAPQARCPLHLVHFCPLCLSILSICALF
jgi:hypothetical protein